MRPRTLLASLATAPVLLLALSAPATAEPPEFLADQVTDSAGVLGPGDAEEIQQAFDAVQAETGQVLFVTYVNDFDGLSADEWGQQAAEASNLGPENILLAIGVDIRSYSYGLHSQSEISDAELNDIISADVSPQLSAEDWAGAGVGFAEGVQGELTGGGGAGLFGTVLVVGLLAILGIGLIAMLRRRRTDAGPRPERRLPKDHPLNLPTPELATRAGAALVAADDAIRSSEEELGFAKAQFGLQATDAFTAALAEAKQRAQRAFHLRQLLDDDRPETEQEQRQMYAEILQHTDAINETLGAQARQFAELRDMQARAPEVLDELEQRAGEVTRQIEGARAELARLATQFPQPTLASVSGNPDRARALLASATQAVADGRAKVQAGDRATAVTHARVAEEAIHQADTLLRNVHGAGAALAQAGAQLDTAIASITADVRDAHRLAPQDPVVVARRKEAEAAIALGQQAREGGDPLAALTRLAAAESAIDAALAHARAEDDNRRRAAAQLGDRLGRLGSQLRAVHDYITTRRGAVGPEARTRLSEATRLAEEAHALAATDPAAALQKVAQAEQMATSAQQLAERDASRYDDPWGGGGFGGGFGGGRRGGIDVGSLILGGILLGGGGHGGGWGGGGGFGGGFGGGGGGFGGGGFGGGGGRF